MKGKPDPGSPFVSVAVCDGQPLARPQLVAAFQGASILFRIRWQSAEDLYKAVALRKSQLRPLSRVAVHWHGCRFGPPLHILCSVRNARRSVCGLICRPSCARYCRCLHGTARKHSAGKGKEPFTSIAEQQPCLQRWQGGMPAPQLPGGPQAQLPQQAPTGRAAGGHAAHAGAHSAAQLSPGQQRRWQQSCIMRVVRQHKPIVLCTATRGRQPCQCCLYLQHVPWTGMTANCREPAEGAPSSCRLEWPP